MIYNPAHAPYEAHDHDFFEIVLISSGQAVHRSAEGEGMLRAGDVLVIRPGVWHAYMECSRCGVYNCLFPRDLFNRELAWVLDDPVLCPIFLGGDPSQRLFLTHLPAASFADGKRCMKSLFQLSANPTPNRLQQMGLLLQLMGVIAQARSPEGGNPAGGGVHSAVARAMHWMESELARPWTLEELGRDLKIDPSYLSRLFKKGIGMPPITYLAQCRDRRAADLLLASKLPVAEIAQKVGWDDPNYFARRFSRRYGVSPTQYRARHNG